jgi:hypothetical protein
LVAEPIHPGLVAPGTGFANDFGAKTHVRPERLVELGELRGKPLMERHHVVAALRLVGLDDNRVRREAEIRVTERFTSA